DEALLATVQTDLVRVTWQAPRLVTEPVGEDVGRWIFEHRRRAPDGDPRRGHQARGRRPAEVQGAGADGGVDGWSRCRPISFRSFKSSTGEHLTVEQAAEYLNITDHFDRRLIRERCIPFIEVGRLTRLRRTDIDDYLAGRHVPAVRR
ncbi:MAG: excisionase family DNA-binding protein, partial [Actinomycetales bacterium]